jgi:hypothetical protein
MEDNGGYVGFSKTFFKMKIIEHWSALPLQSPDRNYL